MAGPTCCRHVVVTGAAGYIGSHAALDLLDSGASVLGIDNMVRGNPGAIEVLRAAGGQRFRFAQVDLLDTERLTDALASSGADTVMHFAALASVGESVEQPVRYWRNNAAGTISLCGAIATAGIRRIVLSSTCATYGLPPPHELPLRETTPQHPVNPYGASKLAAERVLLDVLRSPAGASLEVAILRYFNVAGCDARGRVGEDHRPETHLIPACLEAALGQRPHLELFGEDYPTRDGTCVRDYVHVSDLVEAHRLVVDRLRPGDPFIANVGIGRGFTVREVIDACRRVTGRPIAVRSSARREGDPPELTADASHIRRQIGWRPRFESLDGMVATAWAWKLANPNGYERPSAVGDVAPEGAPSVTASLPAIGAQKGSESPA